MIFRLAGVSLFCLSIASAQTVRPQALVPVITGITNAAGQTATTQYSKAGSYRTDCLGNAVQQTGLPVGTSNGDASVVQSTAPNGARHSALPLTLVCSILMRVLVSAPSALGIW